MIWLQSLGIVMIIALVFYRSVLALIGLCPLMIPLAQWFRTRRKEKARAQLMAEFRELLQSLVTALKAGYAPENAFREAYKEMAFMFGSDSDICSELTRLLRGLDNHRTLEELLQEFAARVDVEEISEFADVFVVARRQGGNLTEILERTDGLIRDRIDVEREIHVLLSSRRYEQTVMNVVPFGIILYISITSPGFLDSMYHNVFGVLVMSGCLLGYLLAIRLSERIMDIRV